MGIKIFGHNFTWRYAANKSMDDCAFCNADGDFLIVPQKGSKWFLSSTNLFLNLRQCRFLFNSFVWFCFLHTHLISEVCFSFAYIPAVRLLSHIMEKNVTIRYKWLFKPYINSHEKEKSAVFSYFSFVRHLLLLIFEQ